MEEAPNRFALRKNLCCKYEAMRNIPRQPNRYNYIKKASQQTSDPTLEIGRPAHLPQFSHQQLLLPCFLPISPPLPPHPFLLWFFFLLLLVETDKCDDLAMVAGDRKQSNGHVRSGGCGM
ncbi:hypothetical protein E2562_016447 [Oryza meyeriana var. granulata]|uniref:Uncharacterized protein n=1 Tax=Oryza meyeriana var. granulata TaxID=110450 RepID=A0A6G1EX20_9ORYZ|nr:hypothetical protein E2562_016447 [Oryza meyeriana var. granulata]